MKRLFFFFLLISCSLGFSQGELPFFEQEAFNFYKDSILTKHPSERRLRVAENIQDMHPKAYLFSVSNCLTGEDLYEQDLYEEHIDNDLYRDQRVIKYEEYIKDQLIFDPPIKKLVFDDFDPKRFKIRRNRREKNPYLTITPPYHEPSNENDFYLNIIENYKTYNVHYYFLLNKNAKVKKWCRGVIVITHSHN